MADERMRDLERRWRATGSPEDEAGWILERLRGGEIDPEGLRAAAVLGYPAARLALGSHAPEALPAVSNNHDMIRWLLRLQNALGLDKGFFSAVSVLRETSEAFFEEGSFERDIVSYCTGLVEQGMMMTQQELQRLFDHVLVVVNRFDRGPDDAQLVLTEVFDLMVCFRDFIHTHGQPSTQLRLRLNSVHSGCVRAFQDPQLPQPLSEEAAVARVYGRSRKDLLDRFLSREALPAVRSRHELIKAYYDLLRDHDPGEETREFNIAEIQDQIRGLLGGVISLDDETDD